MSTRLRSLLLALPVLALLAIPGVALAAKTKVGTGLDLDQRRTARAGRLAGRNRDRDARQIAAPTAASWTGDLSVEIPTLGNVFLAAPGTWSTLCEDATCTETLPPGTRFSLLE